MKRIDVKTPLGSYPILIAGGLLSETGRLVRELLGRTCAAAVVTNPTVGRHHAGTLLSSLSSSGLQPHLVEVPDGEQHKTLETATRLTTLYLESGLDRASIIVALGGGVIGDLAGFTAATYMRGIPLVQVPTTLLAMVDASVGGKTGVDMPQGKNLVGVFKQPEAVIMDPSTLSTLPPGEIASGMAEVIKHGLIGAPALFASLQAEEPADLASLVHDAVRVKVDIVQEDPHEKGQRAILNLGHTFGHALEAASGYTLQHGHAVALGLVSATRMAIELGRCDAPLLEQVKKALATQHLPVTIGGFSVDDVILHMDHDKKRMDSTPRFIIPERPGRVAIIEDPPPGIIHTALSSILET